MQSSHRLVGAAIPVAHGAPRHAAVGPRHPRATAGRAVALQGGMAAGCSVGHLQVCRRWDTHVHVRALDQTVLSERMRRIDVSIRFEITSYMFWTGAPSYRLRHD
jgi:hypothetical protein